MKRLICIFLVLCCMLPMLAACNGGTKDPATQTGGETADGEKAPQGTTPDGEIVTEYYLDTLPENLTGEATYRILTIDGNIPKESDSYSSVVKKALYDRDLALMDWYGIEIEYTPMNNDDSAITDMRTAINGANGTYHAFITSASRLMTVAMEGLVQDMHEVDNLDMTRAWWNQSLNRDCAIDGKLYCSAGPYSEYYYHAAFCLAFNRTMATAFSMPDIIALVKDEKWTLEQMKTLCVDYEVTADTTGDGSMDDDDRYAIAAFQVGMYGLFAGAGGKFSTVNEDGVITVGINSQSSQQIMQKITEVFNKDNVRYQGVYNNYKESADLFTGGKALFLYTSTGYMSDYLTVSTIDYGIIPLPKFDEDQKEYITCAWPQSNYCVSIPVGMNAVQSSFAGLMLEAYSFLSYEIVRPEKYDRMMKYQTAHDEDSSAMLDLIFETLYFDINLVFNFGLSRDLVSDTIRKNALGELVSNYNNIENEIKGDINKLLNPSN